jgi:hypothetical protein
MSLALHWVYTAAGSLLGAVAVIVADGWVVGRFMSDLLLVGIHRL